jgi:hypothetical protein
MNATTRATTSRRYGFGVGVLLSAVGTAVCYLLVWASGLANYNFVGGTLAGTVLLFGTGLSLAATRAYRALGFGLLVGAPVSFLVEWTALILLISNATY